MTASEEVGFLGFRGFGFRVQRSSSSERGCACSPSRRLQKQAFTLFIQGTLGSLSVTAIGFNAEGFRVIGFRVYPEP